MQRGDPSRPPKSWGSNSTVGRHDEKIPTMSSIATFYLAMCWHDVAKTSTLGSTSNWYALLVDARLGTKDIQPPVPPNTVANNQPVTSGDDDRRGNAAGQTPPTRVVAAATDRAGWRLIARVGSQRARD